MPHVVLELFIFRDHEFLYNRHKFSYDITVGITLRTDMKIPVIFLKIIFKRNKRRHYPLVTSGNLHILMKCRLIDICITILFQKKRNFRVTTRHLIFY